MSAIVVVAAVLIGSAYAAVVGYAASRRPASPANLVTTVRGLGTAVIFGMTVLAVAGSQPARSWWVVVIGVPLLILDGVDGPLARARGAASPSGARFDNETDAGLTLVLSLLAAVTYGWWVVALGLLRYVFWVVERLGPARVPMTPSLRRKVIGMSQQIFLVVAVSPLLPVAVGTVGLALCLAVVTASFIRDALRPPA